MEEKLPPPLSVRGSPLRSRSSTSSGISSSSRLSLSSSSRSSSVSTEGGHHQAPHLQSLQGSRQGLLSSSSPGGSKSSKRLERILDRYCSITLPFYLSALTSHRQNIDKVTHVSTAKKNLVKMVQELGIGLKIRIALQCSNLKYFWAYTLLPKDSSLNKKPCSLKSSLFGFGGFCPCVKVNMPNSWSLS